VRFARLALAIVDEQHRFGVRQRLGLREKGEAPDLLVMTATPIPRSLALALYGDLDLSTLDELPPGRRPVSTRVVDESGRRAAWELLAAEVNQGRRAYVVCPLVEEEGEEDPIAAVRAAERLRAHFQHISVGLVHGRMPIEERARAMERFRTGEAPLLVATTVVEVGLDVPEATVMLVERAERFGLSQLHQLRGRVGRGLHPAHCLLLTGPRPSPEACERLAVLERTAALSADQAKAELVRVVEHQAKREAALIVRDLEQQAREEGDARARKIITLAVQRLASEQTAESVVSVLHLPGDEMKGRIIGREGRNIRAFESVTGVNLIIDDTP
jgi:transcription-repair coupling factor (superfamily II helicase)